MIKRALYEKEKARLLNAAMADLPFDGFCDEVLEKAAVAAKLSPAKCRLAFPRGGIDLAVYFIQQGTAGMVQKLAKKKRDKLKIRARIYEAVMARLLMDEQNKEVARRAFNLIALPRYKNDALKLLSETVDEMWRSAGDTSTDGNYYSKRIILSGVYTSVRLVWFQDDSENDAETRAFLERRIENVMQIEKAKAKWRQLKEKLPDPLASLAKWRYGR